MTCSISVIHFCRRVLWYSLVRTSTLFGYGTLWSPKMHPFVCCQSKWLLIYPPYCLCNITLGVLCQHIWCCTISVSCSFAIVLMWKILLYFSGIQNQVIFLVHGFGFSKGKRRSCFIQKECIFTTDTRSFESSWKLTLLFHACFLCSHSHGLLLFFHGNVDFMKRFAFGFINASNAYTFFFFFFPSSCRFEVLKTYSSIHSPRERTFTPRYLWSQLIIS